MVEVLFQSVGDDIEEATISYWHFEEGDPVEEGEELLEVMTDQGIINIPAPATGIVNEIFIEESDEVEIGEVLATIEEE